MENKKTYEIRIVSWPRSKTEYKEIVHDMTYEKAAARAERLRAVIAYKIGRFTDCVITETEGR